MPQKWCTIEVCGRDITVNIYPRMKGYGEHRPDKGEVAICRVACEGSMYDTLFHETFVHTLFEASGLRRECTMKLGITDEKWMEVEETIAHIWTPAFLQTMRSTGWLRLPKIPKG